MSSCSPAKKTFEELPDELLLLICRYLSSTDILFSFYGLNHRLSRMISGHFRHLVMAQIPYTRFQKICTSILPAIGSNITSLVVSNQWKGVLSKLFLNYFGDRMSLTFPHLEQLTLISFNDRSLTSFVDSLEHLPELHEITICHLYERIAGTTQSENVLHRLFTANNNRLESILFDDDSMIFSFEDKDCDKDCDTVYSNIHRLSIDLKTINDLHRLLPLLPQIRSMKVAINKDPSDSDTIKKDIPIVTLKQFQLQSFGPSWKLNDLASILKRLPNLEELSIAIEVYDDIRLINGEDVYPLISTLPLRKFSYFLRHYDPPSPIEHLNILSTWQQFNQEFICIQSDDKKMLFLYTVPFISYFLILPNSIAKNKIFLEHYAPQVKIFTLSGSTTNTLDTLSIVQKCRRIQNLNLRVITNTLSNCSKQIGPCSLPYLNKLTVLRESSINNDCLQKLLEISPNLYHLEINYDSLQSFFDDESICILLKHRITHIYILITKTTNVESLTSSISRLPTIFSSLRHIYFCFEKVSQSCESFILIVFKYLSEWKSLVSFGVVGNQLTQTVVTENLRQWVLDNSTLHDPSSFIVDSDDDAFRLWL